jgi:hypothetical protein
MREEVLLAQLRCGHSLLLGETQKRVSGADCTMYMPTLRGGEEDSGTCCPERPGLGKPAEPMLWLDLSTFLGPED